MWNNRVSALVQTESLLPVFENAIMGLIIFGSIYAAVPAPKHDENKLALEGSPTITTVAYHPDAKAGGKTTHEGETNQKIRDILNAAGMPADWQSVNEMKDLSRRGDMSCGMLDPTKREACMEVHDLLYPQPVQH